MPSALLWHPSSNPADRKCIQAESLLHYCGNVHSQRGDDGIAAEIFKRLQISKGFFVEFGAWDGIFLANCRALFEGAGKAHSLRPIHKNLLTFRKTI
jgi:hypothetical protein